MLKSAGSVPPRPPRIWNCTVAPPAGLEKSVGIGAELAPTAVAGKFTGNGDTVGKAMVAMPELLIGALSTPADVVTLKVPLYAICAVGVKLKMKAHCPMAGMVPDMQLGTWFTPTLNSGAPVIEGGEKVTGAAVELTALTNRARVQLSGVGNITIGFVDSVTTGAPNNAAGLTTPTQMANAAPGVGMGIATLDAGVKLLIPLTAVNGVYSATLTFSAV